MTFTRAAMAAIAAFFVSEILTIAIHGFILAGDYAPFYGTLLRPMENGSSWQFVFLPIAHLSFVSAMVWIYGRLHLDGGPVLRGLKLGVVAWIVGQIPLWLVWYAEQPWPGLLVIKRLGWEFLSSLIVGLTIAVVARQRAGSAAASSPRATVAG
jgi:hypothetical protein